MATIYWRVIQRFRKIWRIGKRRRDYPEELGLPITKSVLKKKIKWIEIKKTNGVDNKPAELLQGLDKGTKHILFCLISNIYKTGNIPDNLKKSIMVAVPKKTKLTNCEEYRSLSILRHTSTILTKVILSRIEKKLLKTAKKTNLVFERIEAKEKLFCICETL